MADNVPITPGSGATIATDDVGGVHHQVVKLALGGDGAATFVPGDGTVGLRVHYAAAGTPSVASVPDSTTSATILASNADRRGAIVFNNSQANLYLRFGSGSASPTDFSVLLTPFGYYEIPFWYTGQITGVWGSNLSGAAQVTEVTS